VVNASTSGKLHFPILFKQGMRCTHPASLANSSAPGKLSSAPSLKNTAKKI